MSKEKGDRRERQLVNDLAEFDVAVIRTPGSGSASPRDLPDVTVIDGRRPDARNVHCVELKAAGDGYVKLEKDEVAALRRFAARAAGTPWIVTHPNYDRFHWFHTAELSEAKRYYTTPQGIYPGLTTEAVLSRERQASVPEMEREADAAIPDFGGDSV